MPRRRTATQSFPERLPSMVRGGESQYGAGDRQATWGSDDSRNFFVLTRLTFHDMGATARALAHEVLLRALLDRLGAYSCAEIKFHVRAPRHRRDVVPVTYPLQTLRRP